jgi:flagellar biosynthesis/type III secretory pathway protein FliH
MTSRSSMTQSELQAMIDDLTIKLVKEQSVKNKETIKSEINELLQLCKECTL